MLQRKQTLWALLAVICAALTFKFAFYSGNMPVGTNGHVFLEEKAIPVLSFGKDSAGAGSVLILIVTAIIIAGTLINIFNYKARKKQLWITIALIFLSLLNIFLYYRKTTPGHGFIEGNFAIWSVLSLAVPLFLILAVRGIMRDQKLVKSVDRLREAGRTIRLAPMRVRMQVQSEADDGCIENEQFEIETPIKY